MKVSVSVVLIFVAASLQGKQEWAPYGFTDFIQVRQYTWILVVQCLHFFYHFLSVQLLFSML